MGILSGNIPFSHLRFKDDNLPTDSSIEQVKSQDGQNVFIFNTLFIIETNRGKYFRKVYTLCTQQ